MNSKFVGRPPVKRARLAYLRSLVATNGKGDRGHASTQGIEKDMAQWNYIWEYTRFYPVDGHFIRKGS